MPKKLYVKKPSKIHKWGLYAAIDIPEETHIIEYVGEKITNAEADKRYDEWELKAKKEGRGIVYFFVLNKRCCIDGNVRINIARLINHSCDPNCEVDITRGRIWISSIRDIRKGEELSYDYGYDLEHWQDHPCRCGAKNCIGHIVAEDQRKKLKKLLLKKKIKTKKPVRSGKVKKARRKITKKSRS